MNPFPCVMHQKIPETPNYTALYARKINRLRPGNNLRELGAGGSNPLTPTSRFKWLADSIPSSAPIDDEDGLDRPRLNSPRCAA